MPKGTVVRPTGKKQDVWWQVTWGSKTGWSSSKYLTTRTYVKDESARYMTRYTPIYATKSLQQSIGAVNLRTKVSLLELSGTSAHIKTAYYHGWVEAKNVVKTIPAKQYRYVQRSGGIYSHQDPKKATYLGRIRLNMNIVVGMPRTEKTKST